MITNRNILTLALALSSVCVVSSVRAEQLNIYAWGGYLPQSALKEFENQENVTVDYTTFESNESMYSKLKRLNGFSVNSKNPDEIKKAQTEVWTFLKIREQNQKL
jgi:spermidine/putrescine-binding protein